MKTFVYEKDSIMGHAFIAFVEIQVTLHDSNTQRVKLHANPC